MTEVQVGGRAGGAGRRILVTVGMSRVLDFTMRMGIVPFFPDLVERYQISYTAVGTLYAAFFLGYASLQIPCGWIADRWRPQRLLALGLLSLGAACLIFAWTDIWIVALAARLLLGAAVAAVAVPGIRLISDAFPREQRGRLVSTVETVNGASILTALSVFPLLAHWVPLSVLVGIAGAIALPLAVLAWHLPGGLHPVGSPRRPQPPAVSPAPLLGRADARQAFALMLLGFTGLMVLNGYMGWLPTYLQEGRGFDRAATALIMAVSMAIYIPAAYFTGWLSDRWGRRIPVINLGSGILMLALVALVALQHSWAALPVAAVLGVGGGWIAAPMITFATEALGRERTGFAIGLMQTAGQIGATLSGILFGALVDWTGRFDSIWWFAIGVLSLRLVVSRLASEGPPGTPLDATGAAAETTAAAP